MNGWVFQNPKQNAKDLEINFTLFKKRLGKATTMIKNLQFF